MHPYCVYKCELIYIAEKHPRDIERAPLEPNTNYICLFLRKWPLSTLDQCGHQRSVQYISAEELKCAMELLICQHPTFSWLEVRCSKDGQVQWAMVSNVNYTQFPIFKAAIAANVLVKFTL